MKIQQKKNTGKTYRKRQVCLVVRDGLKTKWIKSLTASLILSYIRVFLLLLLL